MVTSLNAYLTRESKAASTWVYKSLSWELALDNSITFWSSEIKTKGRNQAVPWIMWSEIKHSCLRARIKIN